MEDFKSKNVGSYLEKALEHQSMKQNMVKIAGKLICSYMNLMDDEFMYFRESGITIIDAIDPL